MPHYYSSDTMIILTSNSEKEVTGGTFNYTARWSPDGKQPSIVLIHQQVHLCDYVLLLHLGSCPIQIGHHNMMFRSCFSPILPTVSCNLEEYLNY